MVKERNESNSTNNNRRRPPKLLVRNQRKSNNNKNSIKNVNNTTTTITNTKKSYKSYYYLLMVCSIVISIYIIFQIQSNIWNSIYTNINDYYYYHNPQQEQAILPVLLSSSSPASKTFNNETTTTATATTTTTTTAHDEEKLNPNKDNIIIDIMSIASNNRKEYLEAQKQTFGLHSSVRNFWNTTEIDDSAPNCSTSVTKDDALSQIQTCRQRHSKTSFLKQYKFFNPRWIMRKPNPIGWLCAQVRPGSAIGKLGRYYNDIMNMDITKNGNLLPDYLWLIDDDTLLRIDLFIEQMKMLPHINPEIPMIYAGCLTVLDHNADGDRYKRYSPFGGAGTVWSRGAIQRLMEPIHCSTTNRGAGNDEKTSSSSSTASLLFVKQVCNRIQENLILERDLFVEGMKLYEFIQTVFQFYPNCFHSDWLLGHFIDYYYLSSPSSDEQQLPSTTNDNTIIQQQQDIKNKQRLYPLTDESLQLFYNDTAPIGDICVQTSIKKQTTTTCSKHHMICHYVTPEKMKQLY